jgi:ethylmalonyl-CoA mutase
MSPEKGAVPVERPWLMRTYSGHSSARASNELYRKNLAKGQTGLSVAFDLPTQTGYDSDHPLARGEVGKVGVPIGHLDDMALLFEGIPLEKMNTSRSPSVAASTRRRSRARPRTTSSRNICHAGRTSSRRRRRCG